MDPSFLVILFEQRNIYQQVAARANNTTSTGGTIVCWVDGVLTKLSDTIMEVASSSSLATSSKQEIMSTALREKWEDDQLRAAAQLPRT